MTILLKVLLRGVMKKMLVRWYATILVICWKKVLEAAVCRLTKKQSLCIHRKDEVRWHEKVKILVLAIVR